LSGVRTVALPISGFFFFFFKNQLINTFIIYEQINIVFCLTTS